MKVTVIKQEGNQEKVWHLTSAHFSNSETDDINIDIFFVHHEKIGEISPL